MAVPSSLSDLSTTAASNSPAGSESIGTSLDDYLRSIQAIIKQGVSKGSDIASASTITPVATSSYFIVTGTTGITSLGETYSWTGRVVVLKFDNTLTLTHSSGLILPGAANISTAAGDVASFVNESTGVWRCVQYQKADGLPVSSTVTASSTTTFTNKTLLASGSNTVEATSGPGSSAFSFRNKIINGDMRIDQRNAGAAQTITAAASLAYTVDRWYGYCTGANVTGQRVAGTAPNQYNYRYTGAASVTKIGHVQRIEASNSQDLAGTTATLSVDLANSLLTTVTWTAWYANSADTFGTLASPTRTSIGTGTFTVSSTLTRYNAQISIPAGATTGIEIELSVAAQTSGTWTIGRVQLESGSTPTPFESRPYGVELQLAQRFYEKSFPIGTAPAQNAGLNGAVNYVATIAASVRFFVPFKITKRTAPTTTTIYNPSAANAQVRNDTRSNDLSSTAVTGQTNDNSLALTATGSASQSAGDSLFFHWTADSEL